MTECKRLRDQNAYGPECSCPKTVCVLEIADEARSISESIAYERSKMLIVRGDDRTDDLARSVGLLAEALAILIADSFEVTKSLDRIEDMIRDGVCNAGEYY